MYQVGKSNNKALASTGGANTVASTGNVEVLQLMQLYQLHNLHLTTHNVTTPVSEL